MGHRVQLSQHARQVWWSEHRLLTWTKAIPAWSNHPALNSALRGKGEQGNSLRKDSRSDSAGRFAVEESLGLCSLALLREPSWGYPKCLRLLTHRPDRTLLYCLPVPATEPMRCCLLGDSRQFITKEDLSQSSLLVPVGMGTTGIEMVSLILILMQGCSAQAEHKNVLFLSSSLHPTVELGKEKEKDCVQIKCKDSVRMKRISMASPKWCYRKCRNIFPVDLHLMYFFFLHNEMFKKPRSFK